MALQSSRETGSVRWNPARPAMDPSLRLRTYGRIRPLESDRTWWERLLRR